MLIPKGFENYAQFILWRSEPQADGKIVKRPIDYRTGRVHNPHDVSCWMTSEVAMQYNALGWDIGFVFAESDPFFFLDLDDAWDGAVWSDRAIEMCRVFAGCAIELSVSGKGLHIFGMCDKSIPHRVDHKFASMELYTTSRFVALTGNHASGTAMLRPDAQYQWLVDHYMRPDMERSVNLSASWTTQPCEGWEGYANDDTLLEKAMDSFGSITNGKVGISFKELWDCNFDKLCEHFPVEKGYDRSTAHMALAKRLAFFTGYNCERVELLFNRSKLVDEKWAEREKYRKHTILKACLGGGDPYKAPRAEREIQAVQVEQVAQPVSVGSPILSSQAQSGYFEKCVYVQDIHRVLIDGGYKLAPESFKVMYGGKQFIMDNEGAKLSNNAWEAFSNNTTYQSKKVVTECFRPELQSGQIIFEQGVSMVNSYYPINIDRVKGDVSPFLNHIAKLLPNPHDQNILVGYMAACVQNIGYKIQWSPLVQGCEGNGKTLLTRVMCHAIGDKYSHILNPQDIGNKFNGWIRNKLFVGIEEIHTKDRRDLIDALKPLITNERLEIQSKGVDQVTGDNRANFLMLTNFKDAIRKSKNDRRYCVLFTAQQNYEDMQRDNMLGSYFPQLYDWCKAGGYAKVSEFLHTYQIPADYDPITKLHRAPETSSTNEAILIGIGYIEQMIIDAVQEERSGFCGGFISSITLNRLLESVKITPGKKEQILDDLGYMKHPGLVNGRSTIVSMVDCGKPIIYLKKDHTLVSSQNALTISHAYINAQMP